MASSLPWDEIHKSMWQPALLFFTGWFYNMGELVECHSGFTYADRPVALTWAGRRLEIVAISSKWRSPDGRHFRVRTSNGQEFELSYYESADEHPDNNMSGHQWQITQL